MAYAATFGSGGLEAIRTGLDDQSLDYNMAQKKYKEREGERDSETNFFSIREGPDDIPDGDDADREMGNDTMMQKMQGVYNEVKKSLPKPTKSLAKGVVGALPGIGTAYKAFYTNEQLNRMVYNLVTLSKNNCENLRLLTNKLTGKGVLYEDEDIRKIVSTPEFNCDHGLTRQTHKEVVEEKVGQAQDIYHGKFNLDELKTFREVGKNFAGEMETQANLVRNIKANADRRAAEAERPIRRQRSNTPPLSPPTSPTSTFGGGKIKSCNKKTIKRKNTKRKKNKRKNTKRKSTKRKSKRKTTKRKSKRR